METKKPSYIHRFYEYVAQFRDVRAVGLLFFLVVVLLISWSGVKVIETNYDLQKQIARIEQENQVHQLANNNLRLQNEYYETNEYLELAARKNFGLAAEGETVLNVPREVALAHTIEVPNSEKAETAKTKARQPEYQRNFQAWMDFLFHRQATAD